MKLKVTAFKKSGKFYSEETLDVPDYPSVYSVAERTDVGSLRYMQAEFTYKLWDKIKNGDANQYCPIASGFKGMIFVFDAIFDDSESGFLTYLLDRTNG